MEHILTAVIVLVIAVPCYFGLRRIAAQLIGKAKGCGCSSPNSGCADHSLCEKDEEKTEHHCTCGSDCKCQGELSCEHKHKA